MLYDILREDRDIMESIISVFEKRDRGLHTWYYNEEHNVYVVIEPDDYCDDEIVVALVEDIDTVGYPITEYLEYEYFGDTEIEQIRLILGE